MVVAYRVAPLTNWLLRVLGLVKAELLRAAEPAGRPADRPGDLPAGRAARSAGPRGARAARAPRPRRARGGVRCNPRAPALRCKRPGRGRDSRTRCEPAAIRMSRRDDARQSQFDWHGAGAHRRRRRGRARTARRAGGRGSRDPRCRAARGRARGFEGAVPVAPRVAGDRDPRSSSVAWGLGWADAAEIDAINILQATMLAMRRAVAALQVAPAHVIVDGNRCPDLRGLAVRVHASRRSSRATRWSPSVSAASILAKVARDAVHAGTRRSLSGLRLRGP